MSVDEEWETSFLAQAREGLGLSGQEQERHLSRLESNLAREVPPTVLRDPALETSALSRQVAQAASLGASAGGFLRQIPPLFLLGGGLLAGGLGGLFVGYELSPRSAPMAVSAASSRDEAHEVAPSDVASESDRTAPLVEAVKLKDLEEPDFDSGRVVSRTTQSKTQAPSDAPPEPTFYEELSYLRRAQGALRGGNPTLALGIMTSLDDMQKGGALGLERRVTKTLALCALGRSEEAKAVSAPIFEEQAHSVYAKRLKESCVGAAPADLGPKE